VIAFASAIGCGHLVAGLHSPQSSPYWAVGNAIIRIAPAWLIDIGKHMSLPGLPEGTADKVGLLSGIGLVLLVIAVLAGFASRTSDRAGRRWLLLAGAIGLIAVCTSPMFRPADLVAPLVSPAVGLWVFRRLHRKAIAAAYQATVIDIPTRPDADLPNAGPGQPSATESARLSRRNLLVSGAVISTGAAGTTIAGGLLGAGVDLARSRTEVAARLHPTSPAPPVPAGADFAGDGTPSFLTSNADFYRIDTALDLPVKTPEDWSMTIHGLVDRELTVRYDDLLRRPLVERVITMTCVSNVVGGGLVSTSRFTGIDLRDLLLEVGIRPGAEQLLSTSLDGWTAGTPVDVVMEPGRGAMLALGMNGEPLPWEHGYPVRMVVPGLYGYTSATKWLADIEVTTFAAKQSYWVTRNWAREAPIKTESRIDKPLGLEQVPSGRTTVAGIAWAQHRGISKVEVRVDGGRWQVAELSNEVNSDTWRMWRTSVVVPPGDHTVESRATDGEGVTQTEQSANPVPDGASGWPIVRFVAA
jgi:DMSO/TMAO reductase YedYZ molybdopterin-dependent catalytic subunit